MWCHFRNIGSICFILLKLLSSPFRPAVNASWQAVNYTVAISEDNCSTLTMNLLTVNVSDELGISAFRVNPQVNLESEFWQGMLMFPILKYVLFPSFFPQTAFNLGKKAFPQQVPGT